MLCTYLSLLKFILHREILNDAHLVTSETATGSNKKKPASFKYSRLESYHINSKTPQSTSTKMNAMGDSNKTNNPKTRSTPL